MNAANPRAMAALLQNQAAFLGFLQRRLGDRATAEDVLQETLERGLSQLHELREEEAVVPWFYRALRNAVVDLQRRGGSKARALQAFATELASESAPTPELHAAVCACVGKLASSLRPEYAAALQRVEVDGLTVKAFAEEAGVSANAAGVRLFRAREALRKQVASRCGTCASLGCLDCSCDSAASASSSKEKPNDQ